jgi:hypothetical protein
MDFESQVYCSGSVRGGGAPDLLRISTLRIVNMRQHLPKIAHVEPFSTARAFHETPLQKNRREDDHPGHAPDHNHRQ